MVPLLRKISHKDSPQIVLDRIKVLGEGLVEKNSYGGATYEKHWYYSDKGIGLMVSFENEKFVGIWVAKPGQDWKELYHPPKS